MEAMNIVRLKADFELVTAKIRMVWPVVINRGSTVKGNIATYDIHIILWHVDPLLDNDRETSNCTTAVAK
jgi:hypothetical protein